MSNGTDSRATAREVEGNDFSNRKLIRPSLHREPSRVSRLSEAAAEGRERALRGAERSSAGARKTPPVEHTHAENFYYQKQIQSKTPMVVVTRDGEKLRGIIEWYDKSCIKLSRGGGQSNLLVYKTAIRYMYKEGEETR